MLTYRTGAAGAPSVAKLMATHLVTETDVPALREKLAVYYANGMKPDAAHQTAAIARADMNAGLANLLDIDPSAPLSVEQVTNLLTGLRADSKAIPGKQIQETKDRARIAYIDLCFSAPKSLSVAIAFAPTEAERAILDRAHRDAVDKTLAHIATVIGVARKGKGGSKGADPGHIAWIQFDHFTARPTIKMPVMENGVPATEIHTIRVAGDPQRHTHVIVPNAVLADSGRVGGLYLQEIKGRIHEWGSVYQAFLATNLRKSGVEVELDSDETKTMNERMARLTSVPRSATELFSKRTDDGEEAARRFAERQGVDWDRLSPKARSDWLKGGTRRARQFKGDDLADYAEWQRQAKEAGYQHRSVLRPGQEQHPAPERERLPLAYEASLPVLEPELQRRSKFEGELARVAAAKGLISAGIESPAEINAITEAYRTEGVRQDGKMTALVWGRAGESRYHSFTTELHVDHEYEAIGLLKKAAEDRSSALKPEQIERAVQDYLRATPNISPEDDQWQRQREMIDRLGTAGRAVVGVGVAGAGKSTLLVPLIDAWHADGRTTYGVTLAWRQSHALAEAGVGRKQRRKLEPDTQGLTEAGISSSNAFAMTAFLRRASEGRIPLDKQSVVIVDEIAQVGTRQILELARLQDKHGFQVVGLGDQMQCQAIAAGNSIRLFQKALGTEQVPMLLNTVRQMAERDRETSLLFRAGNAAKALERKDEDHTLRIIPGGYREAVEEGVNLWERQQRANAGNSKYTVAITAPTNEDVRAIGAEIRRRRQASGEIGPDEIKVQAIDQTQKHKFELAIATGDSLRLFNRVSSRQGAFGDNGTVVEVVQVHPNSGLTLRNPKGREMVVAWDKLRDKDTGRIKLTYGDALTIDARQGDTVYEHITVMPNGSKAADGFKAYTTESRHRIRSWIVTSQGEELMEIHGRRPLGDPRNLGRDPEKLRDAIIENMARNLSRQDQKQLGSDMVEEAVNVRRGAIHGMQAAWHREEVAAAAQQPTPAAAVQAAAQQRGAAIGTTTTTTRRQPGQAAPRQPAQPRPRQTTQKAPVMSETEAQAAFADALQSAGFRLKGPPEMDGKMHRAQVDGDRGKRMSGSYVGYLDGRPAGYIHNFKTGDEIRWRATGDMRPLSARERAARSEAQKAAQEQRAQERMAQQEKVAAAAQRAWDGAKPASPSHPYLIAKGVRPHGIREGHPKQTVPMMDGRRMSISGRLLVPMRDGEGKLWNLQMIDRKGGKVFMPGRKQGLFTMLGPAAGDSPLVIGEGFATSATLPETTALTSVVAFDSGNLMPVAAELRAKHPDRPIIFAADNDHHLPRRNPPLPNVGLEKANEAATAVGATVLVPAFEPHDRGTDWNDYRAKHGHQAARDAMKDHFQKNGIPMPEAAAAPAAKPVTQADRDAARATASSRRSHAPRPAQTPPEQERQDQQQGPRQ